MKGRAIHSSLGLTLILHLAALGLAVPGPVLAQTPEPSDIVLGDPTVHGWYELALGAADDLVLEPGVVVEGDAHSHGKVLNKQGSLVTGDLSAVGSISEKGTVDGETRPLDAPRGLPAVPDLDALREAADQTFTGHLQWEDHHFDGLTFVDGWVRLSGEITGRGTLVTTEGIRLEAIEPGGALAADTLVSLISADEIRVGENRRLRGAVLSGADLTLEAGVAVDGVLMSASRLHVKADSRVSFLALDETPPAVTDLMPEVGRWLPTQMPELSGRFVDDLSLVDPDTVELTVIDRPVSLDQVSTEGFSTVPDEEVRVGARVARLVFADHAGNSAQVEWPLTLDVTAPVVRVLRPLSEVVTDQPVVPLTFEYLDTLSGVAADSLVVTVDGVPATCTASAGSAACDSPPLTAGSHLVQVAVADLAGNTGLAETTFDLALDLEPPVLSVDPVDDPWVATSPIVLTGRVSDDVGVETVAVNGFVTPLAADGSFTASVPLYEGPNPLTVTATDRFQRRTSAQVDVTFDRTAPEVTIASPPGGGRVNAAAVTVRGRVRDDGGLGQVVVAGVPAQLDGGDFTARVTLAEGPNELTVEATDRAGNVATASLEVALYSLPEVRITAPADLSYLPTTTVDVTGELTLAPDVVSVNGVVAEVTGTTFVARDVPLIEGGNLVTASALMPDGRVGSATINVVRDTTAPRIDVRSPRDRALLVADTVVVSGLVNDIVAGTVNASEATVTVQGRPARVANRAFVVEDVPLVAGTNVLEVVATDTSGNERRHQVTVRRLTGVPAVNKIGGDRQAGQVGEPLAQPLAVRVGDATGLPLAGEPVLFKVLQGDGSFDGERLVAVTTDERGEAAVSFDLGRRAGAGAQAVEALLSGFAGGAVFTFDVAPGEPAAVVVDAGDQQVGSAGMALPRPLVAAVIDEGANRLEGVPVVFTVQAGGGHFTDGSTELRTVTDGDGRVVVPYVLGGEQGAGTQVVGARVDGVPAAGLATFTATAWAAGEAADTAIVGVVLDNTDLPVPGVTIRILDDPRMAVADDQGQFRIPNAPVGTVKLIVDGSTTSRAGTWPDLEYVLTTVSGRDNDVGAPIRLLPLDVDNGVMVSETQGGTVSLPEVPGFSLDIAPGSVTFPGGGKTGVVSVTAVHGDKVPMVPNFGQQPRLIVTIQPAGARFEPPARLTLPNVDGLSPGQVTEFYSFDHDLGHFVSIGPASVSADGATVTSDPGVGILKAGWHCGGNPSASGTAHDCPTCQKCENDDCVPDDSQTPKRPCTELSIAGEIAPATAWLSNLLSRFPYVSDVAVEVSGSASSCPSCCDGSPLWVGTVSGGGSITASGKIQKVLSPIDFDEVGLDDYVLPFGIEVDLNVTLQVGPFLRGVPAVSASVELERDLCEGETCLSVSGCGGFNVDVGGTVTAAVEVELEVGGDEWIDWEPTIKGEVFGTWGGQVGGSYSWGCSESGGEGSACYGDLALMVEVEITNITSFTVTQPILQGQEGCDACR